MIKFLNDSHVNLKRVRKSTNSITFIKTTIMKYSLLFILLLSAFSLYPQDSTEMKVQRTIETFFDGFHRGDTLLMKSVVHEDIKLRTTLRNKEGVDILVSEEFDNLLHVIGTRPDDQKWDERILVYKINVVANLAHVWTPSEFWYNDTFSHCGVNSFQLFNDNGNWKIIYLVDTRRKANCDH